MNILIRDILAILPDGPKVCSVCVENDIISAVGIIPDDFTSDKTINGSGRMLIPGLINAHTHAAMTIFRNCADDLLFNDWFFGKILPLEEQLQGDDVYWGTLLANMEMLRSGTTAFIDMYDFTDCYARAITESGIRCAFSRGMTGDITTGEPKLREALNEIDRWKGHDNLTFMLAPHAPYTCDEAFQREVAAAAKRLGIPINTHLAESLAEIETIREQYGCTPVELYDKTGLLTNTTVAAHCVHLTDGDIEILARRGVTVATNPVSNLKLANGVAPVLKLADAGVNVALGTDSAASNNSLNMFRELSMLTLLHKGVNGNAEAVSAQEGFLMATKNGAAAMSRSDIGEIKPGMKADLAILDLDRPNMQPLSNPIAALAYSANGSEVETVMVGGKILMENHEFLTIDKDRVIFEVNSISKRLGIV